MRRCSQGYITCDVVRRATLHARVGILLTKIIRNQMKNTKYPTVRTISKSNIKTVERGIIDTPNTKTHENSISWLGKIDIASLLFETLLIN
jgi:hypothetical protein